MSDDFDSVRDETGDTPWLAHRDELLARVVHRGRALQWRRRAGLASVLLVILAVPFAAVAATSGAQSVPVLSWVTGDDHKSAAATTTTTTSPPRPVVHPRPTVPPTDATTTTTIPCHDSFDPACGAFTWVPARPAFNPLPVEVTVTPTEGTLGTEYVLSVRSADVPLGTATLDFGDGTSQTLDSLGHGILPSECVSKTTGLSPEPFGPWTWSPPTLGAPIEVRHVFTQSGTYTTTITISPWATCGPAAFDDGTATATVTVDAPGTSSSSTTTTTLGP